MSAKASGTIGKAHYLTEITAGKNSILSDEPTWNGGEEKGMNPFEILASALVACTCATLRMYADRKGWEVDSIHAEVILDREAKPGETLFNRTIQVIGNLTQEQEERLLFIANKCPVHQILTHTIEVSTTLNNHGN